MRMHGLAFLQQPCWCWASGNHATFAPDVMMNQMGLNVTSQDMNMCWCTFTDLCHAMPCHENVLGGGNHAI